MPDQEEINGQVTRLLDEMDWRGILKLFEAGALQPDQPVTHLPTGDRFTLLPSAITKGWTELAVYLIERGAARIGSPWDRPR